MLDLGSKKGLVVTFTSDWLYPPSQGRDIVKFFPALNVRVSFTEIETDHGHDAFLTDTKHLTEIIKGFLSGL
jgi:homoserine O-acetyltransferase